MTAPPSRRPDPAREWLGVGPGGLGAAVACAAAAVLAQGVVGPWAVGLHDALGHLVPTVVLPVVVVEVDGDLAEAAAVARRAGASSVVSALPEGHPLLRGVDPEPAGLVAGADGVVRWFEGTRLPLPEALDGLARLATDQLDPSNPHQLEGRPVVLDLADPALGVPALAPGVPRPVDRAELVAVGIGAREAHAGLRTAPAGVVAGLTALLAALVQRGLRRLSPPTGSGVVLALLATWLLLAWGARGLAIDLPVEAGLAALLVPWLARTTWSALVALRALDRVALRLGVPSGLSQPQRSGLEARADMIAWFVPSCAVAWWRPGPDGRPERHVVAGDGELLPTLTLLPGTSSAGPGWRVEPVLEEGVVVGAVGIGREAGIGDDAARVVQAIARAPLTIPDLPRARPDDPLAARLALVADAIDRSRRRAETWEALLAESGLAIGMFELGGDLVAAGSRLRERVDPYAPNPLHALLRSATGLEDPVLAAFLRRAVAGPASRRLPCVSAEEELVVSRIAHEGRVLGLLVQVHDVGAHQRLDDLKSDLVLASGTRLRNALASVSGFAEMAVEAEPSERDLLMQRLRARVTGMVDDLDRAEALARTRIGQDPIHAAFLHELVREAVAELGWPAHRLEVDLPAVSAPVSTRASTVVPALRELIQVLGDSGCRVRVRMTPAADHVALVLEDDSGGLPDGMLEQLLDPHAAGPVAGALQELVATGTGIQSESIPGTGTRLLLTFPLY